MSETSAEPSYLLELTAQIVAAHVGHNQVAPDALPELIRRVHATLTGTQKPPAEAAAEKQQPAVPPKKSVFPDYIICLEDGKKLKMLKRHLQTSYSLTPAHTARSGACPTTTRWWRRATPRSARRWPRRSASVAGRNPPLRPLSRCPERLVASANPPPRKW